MVTPFGLNLTAPNITLSLSIPSGNEIVSHIPEVANSSTNGLFPLMILGAMWFVLYWALSDKTGFGDFKYSDARALNIALGIATLFGITNIEIGYYTNFKTVAMFVILFMLSWILILGYENKE